METKKAFSLLELIFAIVIIGVIASVAIPKFMDTKADAEAATVKQDLATLVSSIQSYYLIKDTAPESLNDVVTLNETNWTVNSLVATYAGEADCLTVTVESSTLTVEMANSPTENTVCKKLADLGVKDSTYSLF